MKEAKAVIDIRSAFNAQLLLKHRSLDSLPYPVHRSRAPPLPFYWRHCREDTDSSTNEEKKHMKNVSSDEHRIHVCVRYFDVKKIKEGTA